MSLTNKAEALGPDALPELARLRAALYDQLDATINLRTIARRRMTGCEGFGSTQHELCEDADRLARDIANLDGLVVLVKQMAAPRARGRK